MTSRTLTTYAGAGYFLGPHVTQLTITATGGAGGVGVQSDHFATIDNFGLVNGGGQYAGVTLAEGGDVDNDVSASVAGYVGVYSNANMAIYNDGTLHGVHQAVFGRAYANIYNGGAGQIVGDIAIASGVVTNHGTMFGSAAIGGAGAFINGEAYNHNALLLGAGGVYIIGASQGTSVVTNYAEIAATGAGAGHYGVNIGGASGRVDNGIMYGETFTSAGLIIANSGVLIDGAGEVRNGATIDGTGTVHGSYGLVIGGSAYLLNGAYYNTPGGTKDAAALIEGYGAIHVNGGGYLSNYGTIKSEGAAQAGVFFGAGGSVSNGYHTYGTLSQITGAIGIEIAGSAGTVTNTATITASGASGYGVDLAAGGTLTNLGAGALIVGATGVALFAAGSLTNTGTIEGTAFRGVYMTGGTLINGSSAATAALIEGAVAGVLLLDGPSSVTNFGTILSTGPTGQGAHLENATLVNGAGGHTLATVAGYIGVSGGYIDDTVTNFGLIEGTGGTALTFSSASDTLIVEAGCAFTGAVLGGGGSLVLANGKGTLRLAAGDDETISGSMATTKFTDFATVEVGAGANFSTTGAVRIAAGQTLVAAGKLTLGDASDSVANAGMIGADGGTLILAGAVTGGGAAVIDGGLVDCRGTYFQNVAFTGATGTLELAHGHGYSGTISGFSKTGGTTLDLLDIAFGGAVTVSFSGTKKGGILTVTNGTHTDKIALKGSYLASSFVASSDDHGGTDVVAEKAAPTPRPLTFATVMAGFDTSGVALTRQPDTRIADVTLCFTAPARVH